MGTRESLAASPLPVERLLLVGELNPYGADPYFALYHLPRQASGNRLREIFGLHDHTYEDIPKINLCTGKWAMRAARDAADRCKEQGADVIVLLGAKVRDAFDGPAFWTTAVDFVRERKYTLVTLPHPSGLNRMWDEPGARNRARALMRGVFPSLPWGETDSDPREAKPNKPESPPSSPQEASR